MGDQLRDDAATLGVRDIAPALQVFPLILGLELNAEAALDCLFVLLSTDGTIVAARVTLVEAHQAA